MHFKKQYILRAKRRFKLELDPIVRMRNELKTTTLRLKRPVPGRSYRIRQGSRYKPEYVRDFKIFVHRIEQICVQEITSAQVQFDLGLTADEIFRFSQFGSIQEAFVTTFFSINKQQLKQKKIDPGKPVLGWLAHFWVIPYDPNKAVQQITTYWRAIRDDAKSG